MEATVKIKTLRDWRAVHGIDVRAVAKASKVGQSIIYLIEKGYFPGRRTFEKLAPAYGLGMEDFLKLWAGFAKEKTGGE